MIKITVCMGSSCYTKGSRQIVEQLQYLIHKYGVSDKVELGGTFCTGKCQENVCVVVQDKVFSVTSDTVNAFFEREVLEKINNK